MLSDISVPMTLFANTQIIGNIIIRHNTIYTQYVRIKSIIRTCIIDGYTTLLKTGHCRLHKGQPGSDTKDLERYVNIPKKGGKNTFYYINLK